ncbi:hypothetical protein [Geodermatophilus sp. DSM 44513]|uniref:hypothetical protein n=1 Tax=Geodermatophilus sp. DSM 44513 TaxID=1528104 RepID=UPI0012872DDA|nr:hypothetical protein [Geodermatophilus sp. DSM 44513]WNV75582.1 hypothetical protein RTG05_21790 [Geodermatophilus sp. DSM 44513]
MLISARTTRPATDADVTREVPRYFARRAALEQPPATLTVSDAVALGIAGSFGSRTPSGQLLGRFATGGLVDSDALREAARFEQGFATPEGHAALRCLVLWVDGQVHERRSLAQA